MADATTGSTFPTPPLIPTAAPMAQTYDFTSAKKFSGESLGVLDSVYSTFGRLVESYFAGLLRLNCNVRLMDVQEKRYGDFSSMFTSGRVMALVDMEFDGQKQQPSMVYVSNNVMMVMMDRLMGGPGTGSEAKGDGFTEIELAVIERINSYLIPLMNDAWQTFYPVNFTFDTLKHNPKLVSGVSQTDLSVIIMLKVAIQDVNGQISICLPSDTLEKLFNKLAGTGKVLAKRNTAADRKVIFDNIVDSVSDVIVRLDDTQVTLKQLFNMQVGDIINLNIPVDSDAVLCVDDVPFFRGELGVRRQRTAMKIKDVIKNK